MDPPKQPVLLNIYDMYWTNQYTSALGVGVFHTGIEVFDTEFAYGGHPFEFSGIFEIAPKDAEELGDHYKYKESLVLGYTSFTKDEIQQAISHLGRDFKGSSYHLMNKNCNHFTGEFCQLLCGQEIPVWVNRLAYVGTCIPFIEKMIPKEWLTPSALEESVKLAANAATASNPNSNPSSSRNSTASGGNTVSTFLEMLKSTGGGGSSNGIVANIINSCNGTRKSSTASAGSETSSLPPSPPPRKNLNTASSSSQKNPIGEASSSGQSSKTSSSNNDFK